MNRGQLKMQFWYRASVYSSFVIRIRFDLKISSSIKTFFVWNFYFKHYFIHFYRWQTTKFEQAGDFCLQYNLNPKHHLLCNAAVLYYLWSQDHTPAMLKLSIKINRVMIIILFYRNQISNLFQYIKLSSKIKINIAIITNDFHPSFSMSRSKRRRFSWNFTSINTTSCRRKHPHLHLIDPRVLMLQFSHKKKKTIDRIGINAMTLHIMTRKFAHVYFGAVQFVRLLFRHTLRNVTIEFLVVLVPYHRIQFVVLQLKPTLQLGHFALYHVRRDDHVLHDQRMRFWNVVFAPSNMFEGIE